MIVLDVETTGLNPERCSIISIGAVYFNYFKGILEDPKIFYEEARIWNGAEIEQAALDINGFTREQITAGIPSTQKEMLQHFLNWAKNLRDITPAGENPSFDKEFLRASLLREGLEYHFGHRTVDLHALSYCHHLTNKIPVPINKNRTNISLDTTLEYVGLHPEPKPHNAQTGAMLEAEAFSRIIYRKPLFEEYAGFPIPEHLK